MKIYTKKGDKGRSLSVDGRRLSKSHMIFELEGQLDSLNSHMGFILAHKGIEAPLRPILTKIQHHLFDIGAHFWKENHNDYIRQEHIDFLEENIDKLSQSLTPLTRFVLPGGSIEAAACHMARTKCRRCERIMVAFHQTERSVHPLALAYINRLSDFLFTLARYCNKGREEPLYNP